MRDAKAGAIFILQLRLRDLTKIRLLLKSSKNAASVQQSKVFDRQPFWLLAGPCTGVFPARKTKSSSKTQQVVCSQMITEQARESGCHQMKIE